MKTLRLNRDRLIFACDIRTVPRLHGELSYSKAVVAATEERAMVVSDGATGDLRQSQR